MVKFFGMGLALASFVQAAPQPMIYWLDAAGFVYASNPDGTGRQALVSGSIQGLNGPDGVAVDTTARKIYWSNMAEYTANGSLQRANLNGSGVEYVIRVGGTASTPKQIQLDLVNGKIYWCAREGFVVQRSNLDGSQVENLVSGLQNPVGMELDIASGFFYFSDRFGGFIARAHMVMPLGQTAANRRDVDTLIRGLTRPIDLALDLPGGKIYWTDRTEGTVHRAGMNVPLGQTSSNRTDIETLVRNLVEPIGISLDLIGGKIYYTELAGKVDRSNLDGSGAQTLWQKAGGAAFTGITYTMVDLNPSPVHFRVSPATHPRLISRLLGWFDALGRAVSPFRL